jgi:hypothetical protein
MLISSSIARCAVLPNPGEPKLICAGRARAKATSSFTFFTGSEGWTVRTFGIVTMRAIGAKSRSRLYGTLFITEGLLALDAIIAARV